MDQQNTPRVDYTALRTNQGMIISLLSAGYIFDEPLLVLGCGLMMLLGSLINRPAFQPVYRLLRSIKMLKPDLRSDHNEPHRFSQSVGAGFLLAASLAFIFGSSTTGWILTLIVILLAGLNLVLAICLGCMMYYWLARLGVPGFHKQPIEQGN